ncbi:MAG: hypothetical protein KBA66_13135 [Leptospiraceae bacterium]|nr:hypothetical protein [Leptospiraceae bacterium]
MNNLKTSLGLTILLLFFQCAGFYKKPLVIESKPASLESQTIRLEFTGFKYYEKEKLILKEQILQSGYIEDPNSELLLEILLEEKEVFYKYPILHGLNFIGSLFTLGVIPYYTVTQHIITYRFSENPRNVSGSTQMLELDQLRGLSMLPITYSFWPSIAFDKSITDSWKTQEKFK